MEYIAIKSPNGETVLYLQIIKRGIRADNKLVYYLEAADDPFRSFVIYDEDLDKCEWWEITKEQYRVSAYARVGI